MTIVWILLRGLAEVAILWVGFYIGRRYERAFQRAAELRRLATAQEWTDELRDSFLSAMVQHYREKGVLPKAEKRDCN